MLFRSPHSGTWYGDGEDEVFGTEESLALHKDALCEDEHLVGDVDAQIVVLGVGRGQLGDEAALAAAKRIVVRHIINMAKELQIRIIAEGVEEQESLQFLRDAGCDTVQGYIFAKPMPLEDFIALLQKSFA